MLVLGFGGVSFNRYKIDFKSIEGGIEVLLVKVCFLCLVDIVYKMFYSI